MRRIHSARCRTLQEVLSIFATTTSFLLPHPDEGRMERRQAHSSFIVALAKRDQHVPVRPGPLSALHRGGFRPGTRAAASGSGTGADERLARVRPYGLMGGVPGLPRCGSRRNRGTPLPAPSSGSSPEDAPSERGWRTYTIASCRSQDKNSFRSQIYGPRQTQHGLILQSGRPGTVSIASTRSARRA